MHVSVLPSVAESVQDMEHAPPGKGAQHIVENIVELKQTDPEHELAHLHRRITRRNRIFSQCMNRI